MVFFIISCPPKQTKLIQTAFLRKLCPASIHETFTRFLSFALAFLISSHLKREQFVTKIFSSALKANFALHLTAKFVFPPTIKVLFMHLFCSIKLI